MTMHSVRPIYNDLKDGDEVILREGFYGENFKLVTLKGSDRHFTHAVDKDGTRIEFKSAGEYGGRFTGPNGEQWTLCFSYPLPEMPEEDKIAYGRTMLGETAPYPRHPIDVWDYPVAFLIEEVTDAKLLARMVSHHAGHVAEDEHDLRSFRYKTLGDADIRNASVNIAGMWLSSQAIELDRTGLPKGISPGKIVIGTSLDVTITDEATLTTLNNAAILPGSVVKETVADLFPSRTINEARNDRIFSSLNRRVDLEPIAHWKFRAEIARHALDKDEALVVVFPVPDHPDRSSEHIGILTTRGAVFYSNMGYAHDEISSHGKLMPGIVHITNARPWTYQCTEGEWDAGMEFEAEAANEATLTHFEIDSARLGSLIRGHLEEDDEEMAEYTSLDDVQLAEFMMSLSENRKRAKANTSATLVGP
jgi:hypothetical protein